MKISQPEYILLILMQAIFQAEFTSIQSSLGHSSNEKNDFDEVNFVIT